MRTNMISLAAGMLIAGTFGLASCGSGDQTKAPDSTSIDTDHTGEEDISTTPQLNEGAMPADSSNTGMGTDEAGTTTTGTTSGSTTGGTTM